ncbi:MAG: PAS domain-containing protein [Verrucomicrobiales bacterium]
MKATSGEKKHLRVLLVEDCAEDAELIVAQLRRSGYSLEAKRVQDEQELIEALRQPPQVILSDYILPQFSALDVLKLVRERALDIPVIIVTGAITEELAVDALGQGASDYLWKDRLFRLRPSITKALLEKESRLREQATLNELRERERQLNEAQRVAQIGSWDWEIKTNKVFCSQELTRMFRITEGDSLTDEFFFSRVHVDDRGFVQKRMMDAIASGSEFETINRIVPPGGPERWVYNRAIIVRSETGEPLRVHGTTQDISAKKAAEEELQRTKALFESFMTYLPAPAWILDPEGNYLFLNRRYMECFDASASWIGKSIEEVWPAEVAQLFKVNERKVRRVDAPLVELETLRHHGMDRHFLVSYFPIRSGEAGAVKIGGIAIEITERVNAENELRRMSERMEQLSKSLLEVQEAERRHLGRELHDHFGQILTAAKMNLQEVAGLVDGQKKGAVEGTIKMVENLLDEVRSLSLELRPPLLDDLGLEPTLEWFFEDQQSRFGIKSELFMQIPAKLDRKVETTCFRIVQEAVTNIVRHAKASLTNVFVTVEEGRLHLSIKDNGVGFDYVKARDNARAGGSIGLLSMEERARLAGGALRFKSSAIGGTEIEAWLPLAEGKQNG